MPDSSRPKLLLVDDDGEFAGDMTVILSPHFRIETAPDAEAGLKMLESLSPDVVLLDVDFGSGMDGYQFLEWIANDETAPAVIMLTGDREVESVVKAVKLGAFHYICKPPDVDELINLIEKSLEQTRSIRRILGLEQEVDRLSDFGDFVAGDESTLSMLREIDHVAPTDATVLITGECGTGKEMVARRIHAASERKDALFTSVNCAALPEGLIESELFGHEKGAFTSADSRRLGRFELADRGTLFLDEIGDSPDALQVKLLRVLEERCFFRVGGESSLEADVRVISATSRDLERDVQEGNFRRELFYRLNVMRIHLLPLRERRDDILPLAGKFLEASASRYRRQIFDISRSARRMLLEYDWPGNIRELRNIIERAVITCRGDILLAPDLSLENGSGPGVHVQEYDQAKRQATESFKRDYVCSQLRAARGNVTKAAARSGLLRQAFQRLVREAGIDPEDFRQGS